MGQADAFFAMESSSCCSAPGSALSFPLVSRSSCNCRAGGTSSFHCVMALGVMPRRSARALGLPAYAMASEVFTPEF